MISIIIPIYNTEKYLSRCIDSVLASSYQDFEIILVNDGSVDSCQQICRRYSERDCRIRSVDQVHKGVSEARNRGIDESNGEWIVFVDSDDMIAPDFLEMIAREEYQEQELLIFDYVRRIGKRGVVSGKEKPAILYYGKRDRDFLIASLLNMEQLTENGNVGLPSPWAKAYKKDVINRYRIRFPIGIIIGEDRLFNIEYLLKMQSCAYISQMVYLVEVRQDSVMRGFQLHYLENDLKYQKRLEVVLKENGIFSAVEYAYYNSVLSNMADVLVRGIFHPNSVRNYRENCGLCREMKKDAIYGKALKYNWRLGVLPRRVLLFFYQLGWFGHVELICRLSYRVLEKKGGL